MSKKIHAIKSPQTTKHKALSTKVKVSVLGAGNMGTAVAQVIAQNGYKVNLWNHEGDLLPLEQIKKFGENKKYLKGIKLSKNINPERDLEKALENSQVVFFVVPSNVMSSLVKKVVKFLPCGVVCVDASKGIDESSLSLVPDLMSKCLREMVASISGPAIARDMAEGRFTAMDVSSKNKKAIAIVKQVMENKNLKLLPSTDMVGVEITGSFKNVYAIAMGLCDGFKMPMNTKSALLVVALQEISLLVEEMGGRKKTVYSLSGLGDLVGTGLCKISRNRRFGEYLAAGFKKDEAVRKVKQIVEGIGASKTLKRLSDKYKIQLPFADMVYRIIWQNKNPKKELESFLRNINFS